jgi:membrane protease YdiL (CAAX protease family)
MGATSEFESRAAKQSPSPGTGPLLVAHPGPRPVAKECGLFLLSAFGITWLIWIPAIGFGAGPGKGEAILAFGSAGPAMAAIFLSRSGRKGAGVRVPVLVSWFAILWGTGCALYVAADKIRGVLPKLSLPFGLTVGLLAVIPTAICSGAFSPDSGVRNLLATLVVPQNWRWPALAFWSFPAILLVPSAILEHFGFPLVWPRSGGTPSSLAFYGLVLFFRNLFFAAFLEEPGWRGFLLPRLQRRCSPLLASLFVWLPWALWHGPLDFSGGVGRTWMSYIQVRVVFLIPITIIMTWLYKRSGGNLLTCAVFHAGMNTFPFFLPYAPPVLGLIFVWAIYALVEGKMWRREGKASTPGPLPSAGFESGAI